MNIEELALAIDRLADVRSKRSRAHPFINEREFRSKLMQSDELAMMSFMMQYRLQEDHEQDSRETIDANKRGFMSSHAKTATMVAESIVMCTDCPVPYKGFRADGLVFQDPMAYAMHVGRRYAASTLRATVEVLKKTVQED